MTRSELKNLIINEVKDVEQRLTLEDYENAVDRALEYIEKDLLITKTSIIDFAPAVNLTLLPNYTVNYSKLISLGRILNDDFEFVSSDYYILDDVLYCKFNANKLVITYSIKPVLTDTESNVDEFKLDLLWLGTAFCFMKLANSYVQSVSPVVEAQYDFRTKREEYTKQAMFYFELYEKRKNEVQKRRANAIASFVNINLKTLKNTDYLFHK